MALCVEDACLLAGLSSRFQLCAVSAHSWRCVCACHMACSPVKSKVIQALGGYNKCSDTIAV